MRKHILIITFTLINLIGLIIVYLFIIHRGLFENNYEKYIMILPIIIISLYPIAYYTFYRVISNNDEYKKSLGIRLFFYNDYMNLPFILIASPFYLYDYIKYFIKDFKEYRRSKNE